MRYIALLLLLKLLFLSGCNEPVYVSEVNFEGSTFESVAINFMYDTEYEPKQSRREIAGDIIFWSEDDLYLIERRDEFLLLCNDTAVILYMAMYNLLHNTDAIFIESSGEGGEMHIKVYREIGYEIIELFEEISSALKLISE